jgi:hypothetical protein
MNINPEMALELIAVFAGLWAAFYSRRAYNNTKKILEKIGK